MLSSTAARPRPLLSVAVPQKPAVAQPVAQPAELYAPPELGNAIEVVGRALTSTLELAALVARVSPLVRAAVSVIVSAESYVTLGTVTLFVPAEIVAVFPPSEPAPLGERLMPVAPLTLEKLPLASCERTVTLNVVPTAAVAGTVVTTSFDAAPGLTVKLLLVPFCAPPVVRVAVIVKLPVFETDRRGRRGRRR